MYIITFRRCVACIKLSQLNLKINATELDMKKIGKGLSEWARREDRGSTVEARCEHWWLVSVIRRHLLVGARN